MRSQKRFADVLVTRRIDKWRNSGVARGFVGIGLKEASNAHIHTLPYNDEDRNCTLIGDTSADSDGSNGNPSYVCACAHT
jgi:hypothetical protein